MGTKWIFFDPNSEKVEQIVTPVKIYDNVEFIAVDSKEVLIIRTDKTLWRITTDGYLFDYTNAEQILSDVIYCAPHITIQSDGSLWCWNNYEGSSLKKIAENAICAIEEDGNILYVTNKGELWEIGDSSRPNADNNYKEDTPHRIMNNIHVKDYIYSF